MSDYTAASCGETADAFELVAQFFERAMPPVLELPMTQTRTIQRAVGSVIAVDNTVMVARLRALGEAVRQQSQPGTPNPAAVEEP